MKDKVTIVLFSGELDKALAAFNIAITAATMDMEVTMFFTFWGLNVIRKSEGSTKGKGWMRWMLKVMNRGGSQHLKLSNFNMGGLGPWMIKKLMKDINMPQLEEMIKITHDLGVKMLACSTTQGLMGLDKDSFIPEADPPCGAATYLDKANNAQINLFI